MEAFLLIPLGLKIVAHIGYAMMGTLIERNVSLHLAIYAVILICCHFLRI